MFLYAAPPAQLSGQADVAAIAAEALGGPTLRRSTAALVALALFTSISSMVMAGPRVYARMAEDRLLPRFLAAGEDVPAGAITFQVALAVVVVWASDLVQLLGYIGFTLGLSSAATVAGLVALRHREGPERVPVPGYRIPGDCDTIDNVIPHRYHFRGPEMSAMTLRNVDPQVLETLRRRARAEGRSLNALIGDILARAAREEDRRERMRAQRPEAAALRERIRRRHGEGTPSEKLVRSDRRR